ncbi:MAG: hypothetical protein ACT6FF_05780 [Methanosarcinaceae archaeon]
MQRRNYIAIFMSMIILVAIAVFVLLSVLPSFYDEMTNENKENSTLAFSIRNLDNTSHMITVEIFDSKNTSKFNESYFIAPKEGLKATEVSLKKDTYMYEITLDNNLKQNQIVGKNPDDLSLESLHISINVDSDEPLRLGHAIA